MEEAIASYQAALEIDSKRVNTLLALAQAFQASNDLQAALDTYDRALELAPDNVALMILKAGVFGAWSSSSRRRIFMRRYWRLMPAKR